MQRQFLTLCKGYVCIFIAQKSIFIKDIFTQGLRWTFLANIFGAGLNLVKFILLTQFLSTQDFALVAISSVFVGIASMLQESGINTLLIQKKIISKEFLSASLGWNLIFGFLLFFLLLMLFLPAHFIYPFEGLWLVWCFHSTVLLINGLFIPYKVWSQRELKFDQLAISDLIGVGLGFIVCMILAVNEFGAIALVLGWIAQYFFAGFSILLFAKFSISWVGIFRFQHIKAELIQSLDFWSERIISNLVGAIDVLLFGTLLGADFLGIYEVFKRIILRLINIISISVEKVVFPLMCQAQSAPNKLGQYYWQALSIVLFLTLPISIGSYFFPETILSIFGTEWQGQEQSFQFIAIFSLFHVLLNPVDVLYAAIGKISIWRNLNMVFLGVFFVYLFIPDDYILSTFLLMWFLFTAYTYLFALRQIIACSLLAIGQYILSPLLISILVATLLKQLLPASENFVFLSLFLFGILYLVFMLVFHSSIMNMVKNLVIFGEQENGEK